MTQYSHFMRAFTFFLKINVKRSYVDMFVWGEVGGCVRPKESTGSPGAAVTGS